MNQWWSAVLCAALVSSCTDRQLVKVDPVASKEERVEVLQNRDLDLLFVIDNSGSMGAEQASLRDNFFRIIQALEGAEGLPSIHIGVVTTDLGAGDACDAPPNAGRLVSTTCAGTNDGFLKDLDNGDGTRTKNYSGTLENAFECVATVGDDGCGFEQPLEAMKRALEAGQQNGFIRPNAYLGIVFIQDEDDCSAADDMLFADGGADLDSPLGPRRSYRCFEFGVTCDGVADPRDPGARTNCRPLENSPFMFSIGRYSDFLRNIKPLPEQLLLASIAGPVEPVSVSNDRNGRVLDFSCGTAGSEAQAVPPVRMDAFFDQVPVDATRASICDDDLSGAVQQIADFFGDSTRGCLGELYDTDPDTEGLQPDCTVVEIVVTEAGNVETNLPACDNPLAPQNSSVLPCHTIAVDPECSGGGGLAVAAHYPLGAAPATARTSARCRIP